MTTEVTICKKSSEQVQVEMDDEQRRNQQESGRSVHQDSAITHAQDGQCRPRLCESTTAASHEARAEEVADFDPQWPFFGSVWDEYYRLLLNTRRCIRYHDLCEAHCDRTNRRLQAFGTLAGAGTVAVLLKGTGFDLLGLGLAVAATASQAFNLHFRFAERSWEHRVQREAFSDLEREMLTLSVTANQVRMWMAARSVIERRERPTKRVVNALAHNEATRAMGRDEEHMIVVGPIQAIFAQYIDIFPGRLRLVGDKQSLFMRLAACFRRTPAMPPPDRSDPQPPTPDR